MEDSVYPDKDKVKPHVMRLTQELMEKAEGFAKELHALGVSPVDGVNVMLNVAMNFSARQSIHWIEYMGHEGDKALEFACFHFRGTCKLVLGMDNSDHIKATPAVMDRIMEDAELNKKITNGRKPGNDVN